MEYTPATHIASLTCRQELYVTTQDGAYLKKDMAVCGQRSGLRLYQGCTLTVRHRGPPVRPTPPTCRVHHVGHRRGCRSRLVRSIVPPINTSPTSLPRRTRSVTSTSLHLSADRDGALLVIDACTALSLDKSERTDPAPMDDEDIWQENPQSVRDVEWDRISSGFTNVRMKSHHFRNIC